MLLKALLVSVNTIHNAYCSFIDKCLCCSNIFAKQLYPSQMSYCCAFNYSVCLSCFFLIACSIRLIQTHCIAMFHNTGFSRQFQIYLYFNCQIKAGNCKLRKARDMSQIRNVTPNRHSFITSLQQYALNLIHVISLNKFKMLLPPFCIFTDYAR